MPDNYYPEMGGDGTDTATADTSTETDSAAKDDTQEGESKTALLPKSIMGMDIKAGDTITLKVVHLYEDEIEVEPVSEDKGSMETPPNANAEIDMMSGMGKGMTNE
jgi:hypothetical protein